MVRPKTIVPEITRHDQELSLAESYLLLQEWDHKNTEQDTMRGRVREHVKRKKSNGESEKLYPQDLIEIAEHFNINVPHDVPHSRSIRVIGMNAQVSTGDADVYGDRQSLIESLKQCNNQCRELEKENSELKADIEHRNKSARRGSC